RSSAAVLAFFNRSIATSSCSVPLAFRAMMASTKGKSYIITVSICNWNNAEHCDASGCRLDLNIMLLPV
ncbi:MAG: hypothetical protein Q7T35_06240, partial [Nitrosomonas sp.]|nr:hypothetical protein [Nitrosomonas sp.]